MKRLRRFHEMKLQVEHTFDIFGQIEFYETLWNGTPSDYRDYQKTKAHVLELRPYIEQWSGEKVLTHIDAVPDNFLFTQKNGEEEIRLIDWEYAGMQDPHVDIAMFAIYAMYGQGTGGCVDRCCIFRRDAKERSGSRYTAILRHADFCGATGASIRKALA